MDYLPYEVIFQILIRLPVESLFCFKLVCKLWYRMITLDHSFIKAHLHHAKNKNDDLSFRRHLVVSKCDMFSFGYENPLNKRSEYFSIPFKSVLDFTKPFKNVAILASCDGLVLLSHNQYDYYLWNPSTKLYKRIWGFYCFQEDCAAFGLGYDEASKAYKVVRMLIVDTEDDEDNDIRVYNCRTNHWKRLVYPFPYNMYKDTTVQCVVVNGAPHWLLLRNKDGKDKKKGDLVIIFFDLREEKFKEVGGPDWLAQGPYTELCAFNENLCLVRYVSSSEEDERLRIEIWVMKKYGVAQSWACLFTAYTYTNQFGASPVGVEPLFSTRHGKILMERERSALEFYDPSIPDIDSTDHQELQHVLYEEGYTYRLQTTTYVESLVSPHASDRAVG